MSGISVTVVCIPCESREVAEELCQSWRDEIKCKRKEIVGRVTVGRRGVGEQRESGEGKINRAKYKG
jgi:phage gp36-like protein